MSSMSDNVGSIAASTASAASKITEVPSKILASAHESTKSPRVAILDVAKGLAILFVPFYHICVYDEPFMWWGEVFGCLLLGFFFFTSGYKYDPYKRTFKEQVLHRLRKLMLPTFIWLALISVITSVFFVVVEGYTLKEVSLALALTVLRPELVVQLYPATPAFDPLFNTLSPVWFIWTLFLSNLLLYAVAKFAIRSPKHTAVVASLLVLASGIMLDLGWRLPWNIQLVPFYAALMVTAMSISHFGAGNGNVNPSPVRLMGRKRNIKPRSTLDHWLMIGISLVIVLLISYIAPTYKLFLGSLGNNGGWNTITFFLGTTSFTVVYVELLARFVDGLGLLREAFVWLGQNSLPFLIIHGSVGVMLAYLMNVPAKLTVMLWQSGTGPWMYLNGLPLHMGTFAIYLLTCFVCIAISLVWNYLYEMRHPK